jgi:alpha-mannosidase
MVESRCSTAFLVGNDLLFIDAKRLCRKYTAEGLQGYPPSEKQSGVAICEKTIENRFFRIEFDELMQIKSLLDKRVNRQVIKDGKRGNVLRVYEDLPFQYDCWNLEIYHRDKSWVVDEVVSCEEIRNGARSGFRVVKRFMSSTIIQNIWVYDDIDRIDFETQADWQEVNLLLKAEFTVDINADTAVYDIQFGHTRRPTHTTQAGTERSSRSARRSTQICPILGTASALSTTASTAMTYTETR